MSLSFPQPDFFFFFFSFLFFFFGTKDAHVSEPSLAQHCASHSTQLLTSNSTEVPTNTPMSTALSNPTSIQSFAVSLSNVTDPAHILSVTSLSSPPFPSSSSPISPPSSHLPPPDVLAIAAQTNTAPTSGHIEEESSLSSVSAAQIPTTSHITPTIASNFGNGGDVSYFSSSFAATSLPSLASSPPSTLDGSSSRLKLLQEELRRREEEAKQETRRVLEGLSADRCGLVVQQATELSHCLIPTNKAIPTSTTSSTGASSSGSALS